MATSTKNYEASVDETFGQMLRIAQVAMAADIQAENPTTLTPPSGFDTDGVEADRQKAWHLKRSQLATVLLRQRPENELSFGLSVAEALDAYIEDGTPKKGADSQAITDSDMEWTVSGLWDSWSGNHNAQ